MFVLKLWCGINACNAGAAHQVIEKASTAYPTCTHDMQFYATALPSTDAFASSTPSSSKNALRRLCIMVKQTIMRGRRGEPHTDALVHALVPSVCAQLGHGDTSVRLRALEATVAAYALLGEAFREHLDQMSEVQARVRSAKRFLTVCCMTSGAARSC